MGVTILPGSKKPGKMSSPFNGYYVTTPLDSQHKGLMCLCARTSQDKPVKKPLVHGISPVHTLQGSHFIIVLFVHFLLHTSCAGTWELQSTCRAHKQPLSTRIHTCGQFRVPSEANICFWNVGGSWSTWGKHTHTHRSEQGLKLCEADAQTTAPMRCRIKYINAMFYTD